MRRGTALLLVALALGTAGCSSSGGSSADSSACRRLTQRLRSASAADDIVEVGDALAKLEREGCIPASAMADVPPVVGETYSQAKATLIALGFKVRRVDVDEPTAPSDQVLDQRPEAGSRVNRAGTVTLTVSGSSIIVPDVVGQVSEPAIERLESAGLTVSVVRRGSAKPSGIVLSTDPAAGKKVQKSTPSVVVTVSSG